ncbi:MAG TPA: hypothetical protein VGN64_18635 [Dyadobacter sp.]|nr:hypothetical protein [Dyadobacter sp.]
MRVIICLVLALTSCKPKMAGPVGPIFSYERYWELSAYSSKGKHRPLTEASNVHYLSFANNSATNDELMDFFDIDKNKVKTWENTNESFDVNRWRTIGTYIKKTNSGKYFKATVFVENSTGEVYELRLSNAMDTAYKTEHDTLLYTYKPVAGF